MKLFKGSFSQRHYISVCKTTFNSLSVHNLFDYDSNVMNTLACSFAQILFAVCTRFLNCCYFRERFRQREEYKWGHRYTVYRHPGDHKPALYTVVSSKGSIPPFRLHSNSDIPLPRGLKSSELLHQHESNTALILSLGAWDHLLCFLENLLFDSQWVMSDDRHDVPRRCFLSFRHDRRLWWDNCCVFCNVVCVLAGARISSRNLTWSHFFTLNQVPAKKM